MADQIPDFIDGDTNLSNRVTAAWLIDVNAYTYRGTWASIHNTVDLGTSIKALRTGYFGTSVVTQLVGTDTATILNFKTNGLIQWGILSGAVGTAAISPNSDAVQNIGAPNARVLNIFATTIDSGTTSALSLKTNQVTRATIANTGQIYPATDAAAAQTASGIFAGTGVPNNANGNNGDVYFRSDGGAGTTIYQKRAGSWVATAA